jgi:hypothetical protein
MLETDELEPRPAAVDQGNSDLFLLLIFLISLWTWTLALRVSRSLHQDMERMIGERRSSACRRISTGRVLTWSS